MQLPVGFVNIEGTYIRISSIDRVGNSWEKNRKSTIFFRNGHLLHSSLSKKEIIRKLS